MISYEQWTAVSQSPEFIISLVAVWLIVLVLYFVIGGIVSATSKGKRNHFWGDAHFWAGIIVLFFLLPLLVFFGIIEPVVLKLFT